MFKCTAEFGQAPSSGDIGASGFYASGVREDANLEPTPGSASPKHLSVLSKGRTWVRPGIILQWLLGVSRL